jgi:hypothetical protein
VRRFTLPGCWCALMGPFLIAGKPSATCFHFLLVQVQVMLVLGLFKRRSMAQPQNAARLRSQIWAEAEGLIQLARAGLRRVKPLDAAGTLWRCRCFERSAFRLLTMYKPSHRWAHACAERDAWRELIG